MKAEILPVPAGHANGYVWKWRCNEPKAESKTTFTLYYDCLSDARKHGYAVDLTQAHGLTAPGGAQHNMS